MRSVLAESRQDQSYDGGDRQQSQNTCRFYPVPALPHFHISVSIPPSVLATMAEVAEDAPDGARDDIQSPNQEIPPSPRSLRSKTAEKIEMMDQRERIPRAQTKPKRRSQAP